MLVTTNATRLAPILALAGAALAASPPALALSGRCSPVAIAAGSPSLPRPWRDALDALVDATSHEGQPWSCPGGTVSLAFEAPGGPATLTIEDTRGRRVTRAVATPDQLVPIGEALLAAPLALAPDAPPVAPPVAPAPPPRQPESANPPAPAAPREPRLLFDTLFSTRVTGPHPALWLGGDLRVLLPIDAWHVGIGARYEAPVAGPEHAPPGFTASSVSVALEGGRRLLASPFDLRVTFDPSLAIVMMESGHEEPGHPEGAKVMFRLGAGIRGAFRIIDALRGLVVLDAELAPSGIAGAPRIAASLPDVPVYTFGLSLGLEAIVR